jgi:hypothetical protein
VEWHQLGAKGKRYPKFLDKLRGKNGVYAIRERGIFFTPVVYVGESHSGNLSTTMTRHFQTWTRGKKFWRGQYAPEQTDPGHTYNRETHEVAFEACSKCDAVELQAEWIRKLSPRDNVASVDEVPF